MLTLKSDKIKITMEIIFTLSEKGYEIINIFTTKINWPRNRAETNNSYKNHSNRSNFGVVITYQTNIRRDRHTDQAEHHVSFRFGHITIRIWCFQTWFFNPTTISLRNRGRSKNKQFPYFASQCWQWDWHFLKCTVKTKK